MINMSSLNVQDVMSIVKDHNQSYTKRKIVEIEEDLISAAKAGDSSCWITFFWDDGDYAEIIKLFEYNGFSVRCPTSPWEGGSTSYLFEWSMK